MRVLSTTLCCAALATTAAFVAPGDDLFPTDSRLDVHEGLVTDTVDHHKGTGERAVYWCLADEYRQVAQATGAERISQAAGRAADAYEQAAPPESAYAEMGWRSGDQITVTFGDGETCTTVVR